MKRKPLRVTGEDAVELLKELENPTPLTDKQKEVIRRARETSLIRERKKSFQNTLRFIEEGLYTTEQLHQLQDAIKKHL